MRQTTFFLLMFFNFNLFGQYINGPANIRDKPNGTVLFSVNDFVSIDLRGDSISRNWYEVILTCEVNTRDLINKVVIKPNSTLYSNTGDSIGYTATQFKIYENRYANYKNYNELQKVSVFLTGYTFKSNLKDELTDEEIVKSKIFYSDNFNSRYIHFREENGIVVTKIEQCIFYNPTININGKWQDAVVKEVQKVKRSSGREGQESTINLEIVTDYFTANPMKKNFSIDADKVEFDGSILKTVKYGCCGSEDEWQLFNLTSLKKIMDFDRILYKVKIPNSHIEGYIGFKLCSYRDSNSAIGIITFCTADSVINKAKLVTYDKEKFDHILRFVPKMEFVAINEKDKVDYNETGIELWTKNKSSNPGDLSGFNFLIHFIDELTGKEFVQKLEFKNGYINGKKNKEFEIVIN